MTAQTDLRYALDKLDGDVSALRMKFKHSSVVLRTFDQLLKEVNCSTAESPSPRDAYEREVCLATRNHKRKKITPKVPARQRRFVQEQVEGGVLEYPSKLPNIKLSKTSPLTKTRLHNGVESRYLSTENALHEYREDYENEIHRAGIGNFLARKAQARLKDR
jgi:hypothetical protein